MLFNSIEFAIFLPIVFILYWLTAARHPRFQNSLLLAASYFFYGWWNWRFLILIIISSGVDFWIGTLMGNRTDPVQRKRLLLASLTVNLGILFFFKYCNFFIISFIDSFLLFGKRLDIRTLNIVLPIGISFYTFKTISYTVDIYRGKLSPTKDVVAYFTYIAFFPQILAGPIEKARDFLCQFESKRVFNYNQAVDGMRQILGGLLKKVVIADNCAVYADYIFTHHQNLSGSTLLLGAVYFTFQIYGDFSGYSDISIGTAGLLGFNVKKNFAFPYFSRDMAEFWRRWHISLTSWFRDYVYIPLGGSRGNQWLQIRNVFIIFLVSGFWHGANWTFILWGLINACCFLPLLLTNTNRANMDTVAAGCLFPSFKELLQVGMTFFITCLAWIFFRAENIGQAVSYVKGILSPSLFYTIPEEYVEFFLILLAAFVLLEWLQREKEHLFHFDNIKSPSLRWALYYGAITILLEFSGKQQSFIYFQF
ncbi:MAG: MBOAT family O-acyltransferase [Thermodesulfobacteriota bacterium]